MSPEERSEIARAAVEARWEKAGIPRRPRETHTGVLKIGDLEIPCSVLSDGTRVLSQRGVYGALGGVGAPRGGDRDDETPPFLASSSIKPFIGKELTVTTKLHIEYTPKHGGKPALGVDARLLPEICKVWLDARRARVLRPNQMHIAERAELLLTGLARVADRLGVHGGGDCGGTDRILLAQAGRACAAMGG